MAENYRSVQKIRQICSFKLSILVITLFIYLQNRIDYVQKITIKINYIIDYLPFHQQVLVWCDTLFHLQMSHLLVKYVHYMSSNSLKVVKPAKVNTIFIKSLYIKWNVSFCDRFFLCKKKNKYWYVLVICHMQINAKMIPSCFPIFWLVD
jgi:hypothetical protein